MRYAEKKYRQDKTNEIKHNEFRRLRQFKCELVTRTKAFYYMKKLNECGKDSSKIYGQLNILLGKNKKSNILPSGKLSLPLANDFKNFFIDKIDEIMRGFDNCNNAEVIFSIPDFPLNTMYVLAPVTIEQIFTFIKKMNKTFCRNDAFDIKTFDSEQLEKIAEYFCDLVNCSFKSGVFPECEKLAFVRPMLKKDSDPDILTSYRPLYNTSFLSKVMEYACLQQLLKHLNNFDCLPQFQSAYRQFHSVETALCRVYNDLICNKAEGKCSILVLLDLSAAFDTVDHHTLLCDLENLGITGFALSWFKTYLTDRNFKVVVNDEESEIGNMKYGVPQGTILGPVLFIIYTLTLQYMLKYYNVTYHFYADDTQIYFKLDSKDQSISKLNSVLNAVQTWMFKRKLKLNKDKTNIMVVGNPLQLRNIDFPSILKLDQTDINLSKKLKNLGVIFDENLTLKYQVAAVKKKAIGGLINIAKISKFIDRESKLKLVHSLILTQIDFCNALLYGLPNTDLHGLQMILNAAVRIIMNMPRYSTDRITPRAIELHFLPVKARIEYKICLLAHKSLLSGEPRYLKNLLQPVPISSLRSSASNRLIEPFLSRQITQERAFGHCAPRLYNQLPYELRNIDDLSTFKKKLKTYLFGRAYDMESLDTRHEYKV